MLTGRSSLYIDPSKMDVITPTLTDGEESETATSDEWIEEWDGRGGKKYRLNRAKFGNFIKNFEAGTSFGELALLRKNAIRNASIISDEDADLLVISKELFDVTLKDNQEEEFRKRKDFVRQTPLFESWTPKMKRLLEMSLRKEVFPFDSYIVKQGQPVIGLHFIIKGQAKITVDSSMHLQQYPKVMDQRAKFLAEISKNFEKKEQTVKESTQNEHIRIRRQEGYAAAERHLAKKSVTLCVVDHSEIIGAAEQLLGLDTYIQSVVTTCDTETLIIDNRNIERLMYKGRHTVTIDQMIDKVEMKLQARTLSQFGSQVELYDHLLEAIRTKKINPDRYRYNRLAMEPIQNDHKHGDHKHSDHKSTLNDIKDSSTDVHNMSQQTLDIVKKAIEKAVSFDERKSSANYFRHPKFSSVGKPMSASTAAKDSDQRRHQNLLLTESRRRQVPRSRRQLEQMLGLCKTKETGGNYRYQGPIGLVSKTPEIVRPKSSYIPDHGSVFPEQQNEDIQSPSPATDCKRIPNEVTSPPVPPQTPVFRKPQRIRPSTCVPVTEWYKYGLADQGDDDLNPQREEEITLGLEETLFNDRHRNITLQIGEYRERTGSSLGFDNLRTDKRGRYPRPIPVNSTNQNSNMFDVETSDENLKNLERKILSFEEQHNLVDGRQRTPMVVKLKRFTNKLPEGPKPAGTVCVSFHPSNESEPTETRLVRRFIIPKQAYSIAREMSCAAEEQNRLNELNRIPAHRRRLAKSAL